MFNVLMTHIFASVTNTFMKIIKTKRVLFSAIKLIYIDHIFIKSSFIGFNVQFFATVIVNLILC